MTGITHVDSDRFVKSSRIHKAWPHFRTLSLLSATACLGDLSKKDWRFCTEQTLLCRNIVLPYVMTNFKLTSLDMMCLRIGIILRKIGVEDGVPLQHLTTSMDCYQVKHSLHMSN